MRPAPGSINRSRPARPRPCGHEWHGYYRSQQGACKPQQRQFEAAWKTSGTVHGLFEYRYWNIPYSICSASTFIQNPMMRQCPRGDFPRCAPHPCGGNACSLAIASSGTTRIEPGGTRITVTNLLDSTARQLHIWRPQGDYSAHPWTSPLRDNRRFATIFPIAPGDWVEPGVLIPWMRK